MSRKHVMCLVLIGCASVILIWSHQGRPPHAVTGDRVVPSKTKSIIRPRESPRDSVHDGLRGTCTGMDDVAAGYPLSPSVDPGSSVETEAQTHQEDGSTPASLPAVRLSNSFRLPAAAMALCEIRDESGSDRRSPEVIAAVDGIVNQFYHDIAVDASERILAGDSVNIDESPEGSTVVVEPDAESAEILRKSDQLYRLLYGSAAYNRNLLGSAIESTLPAAPDNATRNGN